MSQTRWCEAGHLTRTRFMGGMVSLCMLALLVKSSSLMLFPDPQLRSKPTTSSIPHGNTMADVGTSKVQMANCWQQALKSNLHADPSKLTKDTAASWPSGLTHIGTQRGHHKALEQKPPTRCAPVSGLGSGPGHSGHDKVDELTEQHPTLKHVLFTKLLPTLLSSRVRRGLSSGRCGPQRKRTGWTGKYARPAPARRDLQICPMARPKGTSHHRPIPEARPGQSIALTIDRSIQRVTRLHWMKSWNAACRSEPPLW